MTGGTEGSAPSARAPDPAVVRGPVLDRLEDAGVDLRPVLERVEAGLRHQVRSRYAFVDRAASLLIGAGGKRFRPMLVALTAHLGDASRPEVVDAGVVVELVHLATLYHDDVIDEAVARRGTSSANLRWGNTIAVATGDYLFARASELSAALGVEVTRIMAATIARLCEGEIREVQGSRGALPPEVPRIEVDLDHYLAVVADKTASLLASSARLGALLGGSPPDRIDLASDYGHHVGMAFQLYDDVLDITADAAASGKTPGTDLREGVWTLPVLYALEDDGDGELAELVRRTDLGDGEVERALALLRASPALERARATADGHVRAAVDRLAPLGDGPAVAAMQRLAAYAVERRG